MLRNGERLTELKALAEILSAEIEVADSKTLPALAKQYRETLREIEEIEGSSESGDEIDDILSKREADGKPGTVRQDRSEL